MRSLLNAATLDGRMIGEAESIRRKFDEAIAASRLAEHRSYLLSLLRPAIWIERLKGQPKTGESKFGGWPDMPPDYVWPEHSGGPHEFIAQLNFAEMSAAQHGLPPDGLLLLFAATTPVEHVFWQAPGYVSAAYCPAGTTLLAREPPPQSEAQVEEQRLADESVREFRERAAREVALGLRWPDYLDENFSVKQGQCGLRFLAGFDLPRSVDQRNDWPVPNGEEGRRFVDDLREIWRSLLRDEALVLRGDHLLGYPGVSSLAYDPTPDANWTPFLCLSSHDDLGWCWHDGDYLHVFAKREDLANRNFANLASDAG